MRIQFSDIERPKAASKWLVRGSPNIKLSAAQEALARAAGYRDWHELAASTRVDETDDMHAVRLVALIDRLAGDLGMLFGDVQYALTKARLFELLLTPEMQLGLRARAMRVYSLGSSGRGKPGTVVLSKARSLGGSVKVGSNGYLLPRSIKSPDVSRVYFAGGICTLANFEVRTPQFPRPDFVPARFWLPYGYWTLGDASIVLYSRDYLPLWHIDLDGIITRPEPWYWIKGIVNHFYFFQYCGTPGIWSSGPSANAAIQFLREHRVLGLPRLVEAFPYMFEPAVESEEGAMALLQERAGYQGDVPGYARERRLQTAG